MWSREIWSGEFAVPDEECKWVESDVTLVTSGVTWVIFGCGTVGACVCVCVCVCVRKSIAV